MQEHWLFIRHFEKTPEYFDHKILFHFNKTFYLPLKSQFLRQKTQKEQGLGILNMFAKEESLRDIGGLNNWVSGRLADKLAELTAWLTVNKNSWKLDWLQETVESYSHSGSMHGTNTLYVISPI